MGASWAIGPISALSESFNAENFVADFYRENVSFIRKTAKYSVSEHFCYQLRLTRYEQTLVEDSKSAFSKRVGYFERKF